MTDLVLDPHVLEFLGEGPTRAPERANDAILARVAVAPQERPFIRLRGRPVRIGPSQLAAAAAVVIAVAGVGLVLREPIADVVAPPPASDSLLAAHPEVRSILEAHGGPADAPTRTMIGTLPRDEAFVLAVSCTGTGSVTLGVIDPMVRQEAAQSGAQPVPYREVETACDGSTATTTYQTLGFPTEQPLELDVAATAGTAWRAEVGKLRALPPALTAPAAPATEGGVLLIEEPEARMVTGPADGHGGIGVDPAGRRQVTVYVACSGDPITVRSDLGSGEVEDAAIATLACDDPAAMTAIPIEVTGPFGVRAVSDGFTWVRLAATGAAEAAATRPEAPALPDGFAEIGFAEGDGENVSFGSLGSNRQTVVRVDGSEVGEAAGGMVAIARPGDAGATVLELWSIADAAPIRVLATVDGQRIFRSRVDSTHGQVFYGTVNDLGIAAYHRVALDGTGDRLLGGTGVPVREAGDALAADDSAFVAQWCPVAGACRRLVVDAATLEVTESDRDDAGFCSVTGAVEGRIVGVVPACDGEGAHLAAIGLDDGSETVLAEGWVDAAVGSGPDGPRVVVVRAGEQTSTVEVMGIDGSDRRTVATIEHEPGAGPATSDLRLPAGDWVLLAGPLGDNPASPVSVPVPVLLNVETGEQIRLVNLPGE